MDELYSESPVIFKNNPVVFIFLVCTVVGILILIPWRIKNKSTKLIVTNEKILFEKGLLSKERSEININNVRSIKIKQTFSNRIFGTGSIQVFSAGDVPEFEASGMPDPNKVRELINNAQGSGK